GGGGAGPAPAAGVAEVRPGGAETGPPAGDVRAAQPCDRQPRLGHYGGVHGRRGHSPAVGHALRGGQHAPARPGAPAGANGAAAGGPPPGVGAPGRAALPPAVAVPGTPRRAARLLLRLPAARTAAHPDVAREPGEVTVSIYRFAKR